jgi:hypothetical protein
MQSCIVVKTVEILPSSTFMEVNNSNKQKKTEWHLIYKYCNYSYNKYKHEYRIISLFKWYKKSYYVYYSFKEVHPYTKDEIINFYVAKKHFWEFLILVLFN